MRRPLVLLLPLVSACVMPMYASRGARPARPVLVATLEQTPCFGTCPVFRAAAWSDGRIEVEGRAHVPEVGRTERSVSAGTIAAIEAAIDEAQVTRFAPRYERRTVTDLPTTITTVRLGDGSLAEFRRYHGDATAPADLITLEAELSRLMGLDAWLSPEVPLSGAPIVVPVFVFFDCRFHRSYGPHVHDREGHPRRADPATPGYERGGTRRAASPGLEARDRPAPADAARAVDDPRDARPPLPAPTRTTPELLPAPLTPLPRGSTPPRSFPSGPTAPAFPPAYRATPERPLAPLAPPPSRPGRLDFGDRARPAPAPQPLPSAPTTRLPPIVPSPTAPPPQRSLPQPTRTGPNPGGAPRPAPSVTLPPATPSRGTATEQRPTELKPIPKRTPTSPLIGR
jgi:hypothetical protein